MSKLKVLIVGASIAGPSTAYWLAKMGANITVVERFPRLRTGGHNVDIRTVGVSVMRKMLGMEIAVRAKVAPHEGLSFVGGDGRSYGTIRATGNPDQQSLLSEYEIYRGDLSMILYNMTKDNRNISYIFGEQVRAFQQDGSSKGPIAVEFANGSPTSKYDLVVACDGATSRTRPLGLGCGLRDYTYPINAWAAYFSINEDLLEGSKVAQGYSEAPGRFISVKPDLTGKNRVMLMGIHLRNDHEAMLAFREASAQGEAALKAFISQKFQGMGWKTKPILKGMMESEDFYASEIIQVKPPSLYTGRFVMVGDAGYAPGPTGGGTSLAIAGGYLLAGELLKHNGDIEAGLRGYEEQMRPLVLDLQKIPPMVPGVMAPQTWWGVALRNYIFAFLAWTQLLDRAQKLSASSLDSSDRHPMPEYEWVE